MRKFTLLLSALVLGTTALKAQTTATFETLSLAHADTFYTNYTAAGTDVGFNDGLAHFPCIYDTSSFGGYWDHGFAYSNMTDSVTSGYTNEYSAKAAKGHSGSAQYAVAYGTRNILALRGAALGHPVKGFYATNNTYAYNSMRDGDFFAHAFHNGDWYKIMIRGYLHGALKSDSVGFYLANFNNPVPANNYILKTWEWVDLSGLGIVDSLEFTLSSTDNGSFGMNTPAYFCMDDFTTYETFDTSTIVIPPPTAVTGAQAPIAKVYPNPASGKLFVDLADNSVTNILITDMTGKTVQQITPATNHIEINTSSLPAGTYVLQLHGSGKVATVRFVKD